MDNLENLKQLIDDTLNNSGGNGSILASEHNAIETEILTKVGKWTGFYYTIVQADTDPIPSGKMIIDGNWRTAIKIVLSKINNDAIDITDYLHNLTIGSILKVKDYNGRVGLFTVQHVEEQVSQFLIDVTPNLSNSNYQYQTNESKLGSIELLNKSIEYPDATELLRGLVNTGTQTFKGNKTIVGESSTTGNALEVLNSSGTSLVNVLNNGKVGIGTNVTPTARLSVVSDSATIGNAFDVKNSGDLKLFEILNEGRFLFRTSNTMMQLIGNTLYFLTHASTIRSIQLISSNIYMPYGIFSVSNGLSIGSEITSMNSMFNITGLATKENVIRATNEINNEIFVVKRNGKINAKSLPTSSVGLSTGDIWNDVGTLKIVT